MRNVRQPLAWVSLCAAIPPRWRPTASASGPARISPRHRGHRRVGTV